MKWICRLFHGVHLLHLEVDGLLISKVINLDELRKRIIGYFGALACSIYEVQQPPKAAQKNLKTGK